jgi:6-phosphofructokinase 1
MQDLCLIPEVPFYLEGPGGLYEFVDQRLHESGHMVIVVAEGAGQELIAESMGSHENLVDPSGNPLLLDVGLWLSQNLKVCLLLISIPPIGASFIYEVSACAIQTH